MHFSFQFRLFAVVLHTEPLLLLQHLRLPEPSTRNNLHSSGHANLHKFWMGMPFNPDSHPHANTDTYSNSDSNPNADANADTRTVHG